MRFSGIVGALVTALVLSVGVAGPAEAASAVQFRTFYYDSPGSDTRTNSSLNGEWFALKNVSATRVNLSGWKIRDLTGYTYTFATTFYLNPGATVKVHTGKGTNTASHRYWGRGSYVWNNTGDKASMRNKAGTLKDTCSWSSTGSGYKAC
jgi:Lamin Tail Domain